MGVDDTVDASNGFVRWYCSYEHVRMRFERVRAQVMYACMHECAEGRGLIHTVP